MGFCHSQTAVNKAKFFALYHTSTLQHDWIYDWSRAPCKETHVFALLLAVKSELFPIRSISSSHQPRMLSQAVLQCAPRLGRGTQLTSKVLAGDRDTLAGTGFNLAQALGMPFRKHCSEQLGFAEAMQRFARLPQ